MRIPIVAGIVAAVCVALAAPAVAAPAAPAVAAPAATPTPGGGLSARDKAFLTAAGRGAEFEVASGRLAVDRGADQRIRAFGNRMIRDHGQEVQQLQSLGRTLRFTPPTGLAKDQQAVIAIWSSLRGGPFDCSYAPTMQADHEVDLGMYAAMARHADNPQVRAFAQGQLKVLRQHLQLATMNLTGLNCSAPPPPSPPPPVPST